MGHHRSSLPLGATAAPARETALPSGLRARAASQHGRVAPLHPGRVRRHPTNPTPPLLTMLPASGGGGVLGDRTEPGTGGGTRLRPLARKPQTIGLTRVGKPLAQRPVSEPPTPSSPLLERVASSPFPDSVSAPPPAPPTPPPQTQSPPPPPPRSPSPLPSTTSDGAADSAPPSPPPPHSRSPTPPVETPSLLNLGHPE
eukprot:TRINITY_DN451_c0_g1_i1.p1 TRINITY_DN451_c0_g1~~TRINITY_DN451_c0_g1_i1.p1  ORF type:complete len:199 (-),score=13.73 TRINITY_DN451_c0_g1_i1:206-802(-)